MNNSSDLFGEIKNMKLPVSEYAIFGSGPMCVRNLKSCSDSDIDIIASEELFDVYRNESGWEFKANEHGDEYLKNGNIEIWKNWRPGEWNIHELIKNAEIIDGIPFVRLSDVLKWKQFFDREKDKKDVEILKKYLNKS